MFVCNECLKTNGVEPIEWASHSHGSCEVCGRNRRCEDYHGDATFSARPETDHYAESRKLHPSLYSLLSKLAKIIEPESYLEIGVREGCSLRCVLESAPKLKRIVLCDTWGDVDGGTGRGSHEHLEPILAPYHGLEVTFLDGRSHDIIKTLPNSETYDMILVDGDHSLEGARQDLEDCWRLLTPGGVLLLDDTNQKGQVCHPYLKPLFLNYMRAHGCQECTEENDAWSGVMAMRRPFDKEAEKTAVVVRCGGFGDCLWCIPILENLKALGYKTIFHGFRHAEEVFAHDPRMDQGVIHPEPEPTGDGVHKVSSLAIQMPRGARMINFGGIVEWFLLEGMVDVHYLYGCWQHPKRYEIGCEACERRRVLRDERVGKISYQDAMAEAAGMPELCGQIGEMIWTDEEAKEAIAMMQPWEGKFVIFWSLSTTFEHKQILHWGDICQEFCNRHSDALVFGVGDKDCGLIAHKGEERIKTIVGEWPIRISMLLTQRADLVIGGETALLNAAGPFETPKILILSHSSHDNLAKYWKNTVSIKPPVPCYPCHQMHRKIKKRRLETVGHGQTIEVDDWDLSCPTAWVKRTNPDFNREWPLCATAVKAETVLAEMERVYDAWKLQKARDAANGSRFGVEGDSHTGGISAGVAKS